jgi:hypothetical protein
MFLLFFSYMLINEFKIAFDFDNFDSDLMNIKLLKLRRDGGCIWVIEFNDSFQIIETVEIGELKEFASASVAELNRIFPKKLEV